MAIECSELKKALIRFNEEHKEIDKAFFSTIGQGVNKRGHLRPIDLFCIICWKVVPPSRALTLAFDSIIVNKKEGKDVKQITKEGIELAKKGMVKEAVEKLTELYGVGVPVASAILTFSDPERYGAVDVRAWKALYGKERFGSKPEQYERYLKDLRKLAKKCQMRVRDVDAALWWIGGEK